MKKKLFLVLAVVAVIFIYSCNKNDDNSTTTPNSIIGTWKLVEEYENNQLKVSSSCALMETYIFGEKQFTHELYGNGGRGSDDSLSQKGGDDDDDDNGDDNSDDSDDSSDDNSDDHSDDHSDDTSDDTTDDGGNTGGNCVKSDTLLGYWVNHAGTEYILTSDNNIVNKNIIFTDDSNKFYFEEVVTVNGVQVTKKYVFQKQ